jgi:hypothetical protein
LLTLVVIPIMYDLLDRKTDASYKARGDVSREALAKADALAAAARAEAGHA